MKPIFGQDAVAQKLRLQLCPIDIDVLEVVDADDNTKVEDVPGRHPK